MSYYNADRFHVPGKRRIEQHSLRKSPLFYDLPLRVQQELFTLATFRAVQKKDILFMEGDKVQFLYWVLEGKMREYYCNCQGDECLRQLIDAHNFISPHKLFDSSDRYGYTCEALGSGICVSWPREEFLTLVKRCPELAERMLGILAEYMEIGCRKACICRKPATIARIAGYLLSRSQELQNYRFLSMGRNGGSQSFSANIRPSEMTAALLCLSRETFSRSLSALQERGVVTVQRGVVEIIDMEALKELSGLGE